MSKGTFIASLFGLFLLFGAIGSYVDPKPPSPPPPPPQPSCETDWALCADNADMANNWRGWTGVKVDCKIAANEVAKYGAPEWPWLAFSTFLKGDDYPKTGLVTAVEPDAKFTNGFNAKARVRVTCSYDLHAKKVLDVKVAER